MKGSISRMSCKKNGVFPPSFDRVMEASIRRLTSRAMNAPCSEDSGDSVYICFFAAHTKACGYTMLNFWELYVPWKMWYRGRDIRRDISHNRMHQSSNMTVAHLPKSGSSLLSFKFYTEVCPYVANITATSGGNIMTGDGDIAHRVPAVQDLGSR